MDSSTPAQILIDQEIAQLEKSIQRLKIQRNQHSSIAQLPPEVLGKIFVQAACIVTGEKRGKPPSPAERFNFSFVSQHWRGVALSTPEVWGILPIGYTECCLVLLERSKMTDLTVAVTLVRFDSAQERFVKKVLANHGSRLQELTISFFSHITGMQQVLDEFPKSAPRLHTLRLVSVTFVTLVVGLNLPDHSFSDAQLSTLELMECKLDWNSCLLSGLRNLKLTMTSSNNGTSSEFYNALKRMPCLEVLDIANFNLSDTPATNQLIPLPSLHQLSIASNFYDAFNILQCLAVPMSTTVDLRCSAAFSRQTTAEATWSTYPSTLSRFLLLLTGNQPGDSLKYHTVSVSRESMFLIQAWCKPWVYSSSSMTRTDKANFALRIHADEPLLAKILSALPLSKINTLPLSTYLTRSFLTANFGKLPQLKTVVVDGSSSVISQLFKALTFKKKKKAAGFNRAEFPHLENLIMYNVIFSKQETTDYLTLESLQDCLMERYERGAPVQKLSLFECFDIYDYEVPLLEEIVVDVEWDGVELEYEDEDEEDFDDEDD